MDQIKLPESGSNWISVDYTTFRVLHTIELDGHTWIHYIKENTNVEYSCYLESFLNKFTELLP
jgi:hypothetical protein